METYTLRTLFLSWRLVASALRLVLLDDYVEMAQQTFARAMRIWIGMKTHSTAATDNSQSGILGAQHSLDLRKFSCSFFLPLCLFRVSFL